MSKPVITAADIYEAKSAQPEGGVLYAGANAIVTHEAMDTARAFGFTIVRDAMPATPSKDFQGAGYVLGFDECRGTCPDSPSSDTAPSPKSSPSEVDPTCVAGLIAQAADGLTAHEIETVVSAVYGVLDALDSTK